MHRDSLHLTLAFLGEQSVGRIDVLRSLAEGVRGEPFVLMLSCLGSYQRNRVVWAGPETTPTPLILIVERLGAALRSEGFPVESRPFSAHVTLVRNARQAPSAMIDPPLRWHVDHFVLMRSRLGSDGARYEEVGRWPLNGPADGKRASAAGAPGQ